MSMAPNRRLRAEKTEAIQARDDFSHALEMALAHSESLRLELNQKFAELVEARIAKDKAVEKTENCWMEKVDMVCRRALRMLERVREMAEDVKPPEKEEEAEDESVKVLMRPLVEEMKKIESIFEKRKRSVD